MFGKISDDIYRATIQKLAFWSFDPPKKVNSIYADPKWFNEDGSRSQDFPGYKSLRDSNIEHLNEIVEEQALNKFMKNNGLPEHWEAGDETDKKIDNFMMTTNPWDYLTEDELSWMDNWDEYPFKRVDEPYFEGQKPYRKYEI